MSHLLVPAITGVLIAVALSLAAWRDVATRIIPDSLPASIAVLGVVSRVSGGAGGALMSLIVASVLFLILLPVHAKGVLGGGDLKLIAAVACGLRLADLWPFLCATALSGGALVCAHLVLRAALVHAPPRRPPGRDAALPIRVFAAERWRIAREGPLPYGVAIACGGLMTLAVRGGW
jgi:prepilin peptidase CpaA